MQIKTIITYNFTLIKLAKMRGKKAVTDGKVWGKGNSHTLLANL